MREKPELKKPDKKMKQFRLSGITRNQLKKMSEYDNISETDLVILAIEELYISKYHNEMPDKFPNLRSTDYLVL